MTLKKSTVAIFFPPSVGISQDVAFLVAELLAELDFYSFTVGER